MPPKRASAAHEDEATTRKRVRTSNAHAVAKDLVADIVDASENYELPDNDDEIAVTVQQLAKYARYLEEQLELAGKVATQGSSAPAKKSPEELAQAAEKIKKAAAAGIKKQMTVSGLLNLLGMILKLLYSGNHPAKLDHLNGYTMVSAATLLCSAL